MKGFEPLLDDGLLLPSYLIAISLEIICLLGDLGRLKFECLEPSSPDVMEAFLSLVCFALSIA